MKKYLVILLSIFLIFSFTGCGGDTDPVEQKNAAAEFDSKVFSIISISENTTNDLLAMLRGTSDGSVTLLDLYDAAESAVYMQNELLSDLTTEDKNAKEYVSISRDYVLNAFGIANNIKEYLDTNEMKYLSSAENSIELAQSYAFDVVAARMDYLSASGFSEEEISDILSTSDTSPAE